MILIQRKDGRCLNLDTMVMLEDQGTRMKVRSPEGHNTAFYYIDDFSIDSLIEMDWNSEVNVIVIQKEWDWK